VPGWAVTAEATAGSVANMHMIRDGKVQPLKVICGDRWACRSASPA